MEDIWKKCYPMVDLSKFTSNKKILGKVVGLEYNQFCPIISIIAPKEVI